MASRDDLPTLVICQACGGNFEITEDLPDGRYRATTCRWCLRGGMTRNQLRSWLAHEEKRKKGRDGA